jgi:hypothetical protein
MKNEIDTDSNIYKPVWNKMVESQHILSARAIHKQMLEQNETSIPYPLIAQKKKATEEEEEEPAEESGSGDEVTTVV